MPSVVSDEPLIPPVRANDSVMHADTQPSHATTIVMLLPVVFGSGVHWPSLKFESWTPMPNHTTAKTQPRPW